jgi:hypothetical protein
MISPPENSREAHSFYFISVFGGLVPSHRAALLLVRNL